MTCTYFFALFLLCVCGTLSLPTSLTVSRANSKDSTHAGIIVIDCGSEGQVTEVRVDGCEATPCELYPDESYVIEVDFTTSSGGQLWQILVTAFSGEFSVVVLDQEVEADIGAGEDHMLRYELPVTDVFVGRDIQVQIEMIEVNTKVQEICVGADAVVKEPEATTELLI